MFGGLGMPLPYLSNKPGPGRPGWGPAGSYDFQFEVTGAVTIKANAAGAGNFRVSWPNGTTQVLSGDNASVVAPDGDPGIVSINNEKLDDTYCDEFAIVSGQTNVSKVISWGQNPWSDMTEAFNGCTSLSDISKTSFISSTQGDMVRMFNGCTSLLEADIKSWDLTAGADWYGGSPFRNLVNLQKLDMTGLNIKLISRSDNAFAGIGTAVTDGCEFLMSGLNMSTSTATVTPYFFDYSRIKPTSDLSNWIFNPNGFSGTGMFRGIQLTGTNSILNCSGWSTYSGSKFPSFTGGNSGAGNTGAKINFTNLNVSNITDFSTSFQSADFSGIIGLSTWGATPGNVSMYRAFYVAEYFKFSNSDNFSNAFIASLSPSGANFNQVFQLCGSSISSNFGEAPNLNNIDLSNISSLSSTFESARFYDVPDLSTATFPSTGVSCFKTFKSLRTENSNTHVDFSNVSIKISNAREMFAVSYVDSITFGNNVDFSLCTDVYRKLYQVNYPNTVNITYPTAESGLSWAALTEPLQWFTSTTGPTTGPLTTCQVDNLIRSFHNTALNSGLTVDFGLSKITESPSVVSTMVDELENTGGWNITSNTTDATLPFAYPSYNFDSEVTQSVTPTTVPTGGQFSSTDPGVTVDQNTGVVSWDSTYMGLPIIRCTYTDGCYNEVQMSMLVTVDNNYSMVFDGTSYINAGRVLGAENTSALSVSFWLKIPSIGAKSYLGYFIGNFGAGWLIEGGTTSIGFALGDTTTGYQSFTLPYSGNIIINTWYHITMVFDGTQTGSANILKVYINGTQKTLSGSPSFPSSIPTLSGAEFTIGGINPTTVNGAKNIDEVAIFDRALTAPQVKLIYDANSANKSIKLSSLPGGAPVAWYRMGD
jgi:hypothetical protein